MNNESSPVVETPLETMMPADQLRATGDAWSMAAIERQQEGWVYVE